MQCPYVNTPEVLSKVLTLESANCSGSLTFSTIISEDLKLIKNKDISLSSKGAKTSNDRLPPDEPHSIWFFHLQAQLLQRLAQVLQVLKAD